MKKKVILILFTVLFLANSVTAQTNFTAEAIDKNTEKSLSTHFKNFSLFRINVADIYRLTQQQNDNAQFNLELPGFDEWDFSITKHDILSEDYTLTANTPTGKITYPKPACMTFVGSLTDKNDSKVILTIDKTTIFGMIKCDGIEYFIEPLKYLDKQGAKDVFVIYDTRDVINDPKQKCGLEEVTKVMSNTKASTATQSGTNCLLVKLGIASDASMVTTYGSVDAVQTYNIAVMNIVQWRYINFQFNDNIQFKLVKQYVSTTSANDPHNGATDASTILKEFRTWGNNNGFGVPIDLGLMRSALGGESSFSDGSTGIAYKGVLCTQDKYAVVHVRKNLYTTAGTTTHEMGHNFDLDHTSGDDYIMTSGAAPTATQWAPSSITDFNAYTPTIKCLSQCSTEGKPIADFIASSQAMCPGGSVQFTDHSLNGPTSWSWTFPSGTPAVSVDRNPIVTFNTTGIKNITLTSTNALGTSTVVTKSIFVAAAPAVACSHPRTSSSSAGVTFFKLNNISKASGGATADGNTYIDNSCTANTQLSPNTSYTGSATVGSSSTSNELWVYIDYNNDGDFNDAGESLFTTAGTRHYGAEVPFTFITPLNPLADKLLRLRVMACEKGISQNPCADPANGQVEDYAVYFPSSSPLNINDYNLKDNIAIYPNPTKDNLFLKLADNSIKVKSIKLYSLTGQLLFEKKNTNFISLENSPKGLFLIEIETTRGKSWQRIIHE